MILLLLLSCAPEPGPGTEGEPWQGCGDGRLDPGEQCDDGQANDDLLPDACRSSCLLPACGDGVPDAGEACDDGGPWGGDGCAPDCTVEDGQLEVEPNQPWDAASPWEGQTVYGGLSAGDEDCVAVELATCESISARLLGPCPSPATLRLHDPSGTMVATGGPAADGCATLDPMDAEGARFAVEGSWAVCLQGVLDAEVPAYALELEVLPADTKGLPTSSAEDLDGDGLPDGCDPDRDGDGVDDVDDNCPSIPNGSADAPLSPDSSGFFRQWLAIGPFTGLSSPDSCLPSAESLVGEDDATVWPSLGERVDDKAWQVLWSTDSRVDLLTFATVDAPREAYLASYIYSETSRTLTLALGPDDGARAWLDEVEVLSINGCQGTNVDQFQAELTLPAGWSRLLLKVHDQGGGWGSYVRLLDAGVPVTELELSLSPEGSWSPGQSDLDGDGLGDVCDPTPAG